MGKLLEVFKDIEITVKGGSRFGRYKTLCRILPKPSPKKIEVKDLREYAESLNKHHPDRKFYVKRVKREGLTLHVLDQLTYVKEPVEELKSKLEALENEIIALSQETEDLEERSKPIRQDYWDCSAEVERIQKKRWLIRVLYTFKLKGLKKRIQKLAEQLRSFEDRLTPLKAKLADLQSEREALKNQIEANGMKEVQGRLPIYFDVEGQRAFVDEDDYNKEPKLSNYLLMRCLGALGWSQTKYERILGEA